MQGKSVHVGPESNDGPRTETNLGDNAGFGKWVFIRDAESVKFPANKSTGVVFFKSEFWVFMDLSPDGY